MSDDVKDRLGLTVVVLFVAGLLFVCGYLLGRGVAHQEAARVGAARYEADPVTGVTRFVWVVVEGR